MAKFEIIFFACVFAVASCVNPAEKTASYWRELGEEELKNAISKEKLNKDVAKNVIVFLGDGMSGATQTAARILKGQLDGNDGEESKLTMDKLSHTGKSRTYGVDKQVADSACTATAYLCGVKTKEEMMGVTASARKEDCRSDDPEANYVDSVLVDGWKEGKSAGIVTTTRITHATPGTIYAHTFQRLWHSDADISEEDKQYGCKDIAQQFLDSSHMFKVVLGGGRENFHPNNTFDVEYPYARNKRLDGQNLVQKWMEKQSTGGKKAKYVWKKDDFYGINPDDTDYLLGLFQPVDMQYDAERDSNDAAGEPSLAEMTEKAILMLQKNPKGFMLLVEGGRIDHAHHGGKAYLALHDTLAFDEAVDVGIKMTSENDSLIIVTADHGHTMTLGGDSDRGNPIFGLAPSNENPKIDKNGRTYTTLIYANGPGNKAAHTDEECHRANLTEKDTALPGYRQFSAIPLKKETHGGEDMSIFAQGPMSHLFHGVHEQSYIATVIRYASCIGPYTTHRCHSVANEKPDQDFTSNFLGKNLTSDHAQVGLYVMFVLLLLCVFLLVICGIWIYKLRNSTMPSSRPEKGHTMMEQNV